MKLSHLNEMKDPKFEKGLKDIAQMTDDNNHTMAIITGLKLLGTDSLIKGLIKKAEAIETEHDELGHLSPDLSSRRRKIGAELDKLAKKRLGDKYSAFHGAF